MKKIFLPLVLAVLLMLAFSKNTNASTTINFSIYLIDQGQHPGCSLPYTGSYYIMVRIFVNGDFLTSHEEYDITAGSNPITWVYQGTLSQYEKYTVEIEICRYSPPNTLTCCDGNSYGSYNMAQLTGGGFLTNVYTN